MNDLLTFNKIEKFDGEYRWLSNFHGGKITIDGVGFRTAEHAYQALKANNQEDFEKVRSAKTPAEAKRLGRTIGIVDNWDQIKIEVMTVVINAKFTNDVLAQKLMDTAPAYLEEGNTWGDVFWGICGGVGENWLGKILMAKRDELIYATHD